MNYYYDDETRKALEKALIKFDEERLKELVSKHYENKAAFQSAVNSHLYHFTKMRGFIFAKK